MSGYEGYADFSQAQPEGQKPAGGGGGDWSGYGGHSVSNTIKFKNLLPPSLIFKISFCAYSYLRL